MPRVVRNFWIEGQADGGTKFRGGPSRADGGFTLTIFQRHEGEVEKAFEIVGFVDVDGGLRTSITRCEDNEEIGYYTER